MLFCDAKYPRVWLNAFLFVVLYVNFDVVVSDQGSIERFAKRARAKFDSVDAERSQSGGHGQRRPSPQPSFLVRTPWNQSSKRRVIYNPLKSTPSLFSFLLHVCRNNLLFRCCNTFWILVEHKFVIKTSRVVLPEERKQTSSHIITSHVILSHLSCRFTLALLK